MFFLFYRHGNDNYVSPHCKYRRVFVPVRYGGDEEDRTLDLTDANRTLSQLSYAPKRCSLDIISLFL